MKPFRLLWLTLGLAACQPQPAIEPAATAPASAGRAFAQASCAQCHAIGSVGLSSNPNAPPFAAVVNQQDLTAATLTTFLRDAHNYPREMAFQLGPHEVDDLVAYMLTLKDPKYRPPQ